MFKLITPQQNCRNGPIKFWLCALAHIIQMYKILGDMGPEITTTQARFWGESSKREVYIFNVIRYAWSSFSQWRSKALQYSRGLITNTFPRIMSVCNPNKEFVVLNDKSRWLIWKKIHDIQCKCMIGMCVANLAVLYL